MAEKQGQPPVGENPQAVENPSDEPATRWAGKTPEELLAILEEQDREIGRKASELGQLRAEKSELENKMAFREQFEAPTTKEPNPLETQFGNVRGEEKEEIPADFWNDPKRYFDRWTDERERRRFEVMQKKDAEIRTNVARAKSVLAQAKKEAPHVFSGISDREIEDGVYAWLANNWVLPQQLGDTVSYRRIATWIRGEKTGYTFTPPQTSAVPPTMTESYAGTGHSEPGQEKPPIELDSLGEEFLRYVPKGMTKEQFLDKVREEQKRR